MTLIAVVSDDDKFPVLFGDLLLSSPAATSNREVPLPVHDFRPTNSAGTVYAISRLSQKLCMISDHLAVGWSGPRIDAKTIIPEMIGSFKPGRSVSEKDLETFFQKIEYVDPKTSMVGIALEENKTQVKVHRFGWKAQKHTSTLFNEVRLCGSGTEHFMRVLKRVDTSSISVLAPDELPEHLRTFGKIVLLSGTLLGEELTTAPIYHRFTVAGLSLSQ
jgi:hypothetical protein